MNHSSCFVHLSPLTDSIHFLDCDELLPILIEVLCDWDISVNVTPDVLPSRIVVQKTRNGFQRRSSWLKKPVTFKDPIDAVCDMVVDIIHAYVADHHGLLCLHCAAVAFDKGLVIFPNTYRDGKSTLTIRLAANGARIFSDDVLPISQDPLVGIGLGILPRLRIPLPECAADSYREYIQRQAGPGNHRYQYVKIGKEFLAPLNARSQIHALVRLDRNERGEHALVVTDKGETLQKVILRNFARQNSALDILNSLYTVVEQADCYTLHYSDLEMACTLLENEFGKYGAS